MYGPKLSDNKSIQRAQTPRALQFAPRWVTMYHIKRPSPNITENEKLILDPHPHPDQHQNVTTSGGLSLVHAYHVWSTSINVFVSYPAHRMADKLLQRFLQKYDTTAELQTTQQYATETGIKSSYVLQNLFDSVPAFQQYSTYRSLHDQRSHCSSQTRSSAALRWHKCRLLEISKKISVHVYDYQCSPVTNHVSLLCIYTATGHHTT